MTCLCEDIGDSNGVGAPVHDPSGHDPVVRYPTEDDDQVMADLSVEHAETVGQFRSARAITMNSAAGDAVTEDLRQALIHYRALFSDLLGTPPAADTSTELAPDVEAGIPADTTTPTDTAAPADTDVPADTTPVASNGLTNGRAADTDPDGLVIDPAADEAPASQRY